MTVIFTSLFKNDDLITNSSTDTLFVTVRFMASNKVKV